MALKVNDVLKPDTPSRTFFGVSPVGGAPSFLYSHAVAPFRLGLVAGTQHLATVEFDFGARLYPKEPKTVAHITV